MIRLSLRQPVTEPLDARNLFAGDWASLNPVDLLTRHLETGDGQLAAGELLTASGTPDGMATLEGDFSRFNWLGAGLQRGTLEVHGQVGDYAGAGMSGGAVVVAGDAGSFAGSAEAGRKRGMTGGEIIIRGSAGENTGTAMRRGLIAVGGTTGAFAGYTMLAGTILAFGPFGSDAGLLSKRGTLVSLGGIRTGPTYRRACTLAPDWLRMVLVRLRDTFGMPVTPAQLDGQYDRFSGDFAELGRGEILAWSPA